MLAYKKLIILFVRGSNRAPSPYMSKISCVAARKHDFSCGFVNIWGGVLNSYSLEMIGNHEFEKEYFGCYEGMEDSKLEREEQELNKLFDFFREIDKEKLIGRQTLLADGTRKENDAEHAWHMAVMTILLSQYANEEIDVLKTITMLLIHDIVEIDAGDTYAYDEEGAKTKAEREQRAAERIFGILPEKDGQYMKELWEEFEAYESAEAKFAHAMDNLQPAMLNDVSGGKSWLEHGVKFEQILKRNAKTKEGSQVLWEYALKHIFQPNIDKGNIMV